MRVAITRLDPSLPLPRYATDGAAGFDFYCRETVIVPAGEMATIPSNVIIAVPDGYVLVVALRSSTPRVKGLIIPNGVGIIDRDYCGPEDEIGILVYNIRDSAVTVERGERVAQGLLLPVERVEWEERDAKGPSRGGFGSTGTR
jgi:dUTP pyrophosphatase